MSNSYCTNKRYTREVQAEFKNLQNFEHINLILNIYIKENIMNGYRQ